MDCLCRHSIHGYVQYDLLKSVVWLKEKWTADLVSAHPIGIFFLTSFSICSLFVTGLTASLGIGRHIVHLLGHGLLPEPQPLAALRCTPLPPLNELVEEFHARGDGVVRINGHDYRVTHPITIFGWKARTGLAS